MKTLTLTYLITNDGAGGASFNMYESAALAEWVEEHEAEPFGEPAVGTITIESKKKMHLVDDTVETALSYLLGNAEKLTAEELEDFVYRFLPDGPPEIDAVRDHDWVPNEYLAKQYPNHLRWIIHANGEPSRETMFEPDTMTATEVVQLFKERFK